jgi:hypothetical protein
MCPLYLLYKILDAYCLYLYYYWILTLYLWFIIKDVVSLSFVHTIGCLLSLCPCATIPDVDSLSLVHNTSCHLSTFGVLDAADSLSLVNNTTCRFSTFDWYIILAAYYLSLVHNIRCLLPSFNT